MFAREVRVAVGLRKRDLAGFAPPLTNGGVVITLRSTEFWGRIAKFIVFTTPEHKTLAL